MQVTDGISKVTLDGDESKTESTYTIGQEFHIPANSGFNITVESGVMQYICSFIDA